MKIKVLNIIAIFVAAYTVLTATVRIIQITLSWVGDFPSHSYIIDYFVGSPIYDAVSKNTKVVIVNKQNDAYAWLRERLASIIEKYIGDNSVYDFGERIIYLETSHNNIHSNALWSEIVSSPFYARCGNDAVFVRGRHYVIFVDEFRFEIDKKCIKSLIDLVISHERKDVKDE